MEKGSTPESWMYGRNKKALYDCQKKTHLPYPTCYATGVIAEGQRKIYPLALQYMRQGTGGAVIHSGIQGSERKYSVGINWAYNMNSAQGAYD